ncbi:unnamed protein product [Rotaria sordida]|uniref:Mutator-like transposase domain-containing protein n=2 Tax=Rotaria sordida TaxID=392033 RepID=A0A815FY56_9BILA|nr:unnamed protein product [Rotaria sordida]CAF1591841.1 unnamed protein product [Rotaria sordida]
MQNESTTSKQNVKDNLDFNLIIHMNSLISLLKQFLCPGCNKYWDGSTTVKERNGLYMQLEFMCYNCGFLTRIYSSPKMQTGRRHEINVRSGIGGTLCGLGRSGVMKLLGALNLPPPIQEHKYREVQEFILNYVEKAQEQSMIDAVQDAISEAGGVEELTVSGDGAWLTRGFTSLHGIAAICSTTVSPKVIDTNWCSKKCSKCQGAESLRHVNFDLFSTFQENHECQLNFIGTSGAMEKEMIYEMFCRSLPKYDIKYISYIGDGDAKVHKYLTTNPPYPGVTIKKLEDTNHFAKRMLTRIKKIKQENKNEVLSDGKKIAGKGRLTDADAITFKIYFAKAIRESKTDLDKLYEKSWAIFKHHYSTDKEPMHDWCDPQWCKYLQAKLNGQQFNHNSKPAIPRACLDLIKPVFHELCSKTSLARVIDGGSQNANEAFHSLLWTMVPKHRFCSSTILRTALGLSTIIYNDGYDSLDKLFTSFFSSIGYYSAECFGRLHTMRKSFTSKIKKRRKKRTTTTTITTTTAATNTSSSESDDEMSFIPNDKNSTDLTQDLIALELSEEDADVDYEPGGDD